VWIVRQALQRPYTFIAVAILIQLLGIVGIMRAVVNVFPHNPIRIVATISSYTALQP
jgi:hypothetical protein